MATVEEEKKPLIEYPTQYTFKVMGEPAGFRELVLSLFEQQLGRAILTEHVSEQPSNKGKYVSLSVTVQLESEEQRRAIYDALYALRQEKRIVFYL